MTILLHLNLLFIALLFYFTVVTRRFLQKIIVRQPHNTYSEEAMHADTHKTTSQQSFPILPG